MIIVDDRADQFLLSPDELAGALAEMPRCPDAERALDNARALGQPARMNDDALPKIGAPATRALASIGVTRLSQLASHRTHNLSALHGFGPRTITILREAMRDAGISFLDDAAATGSP